MRATVTFGPVDGLDPALMLLARGGKDATRENERCWWFVLISEPPISMPVEKELVDAIPDERLRASECGAH
jgi:hypothetical protein